MHEHASGGHGGYRAEIWPERPLPWMSSGAIWWRGWRRPWHSWSGGEPDNGETTASVRQQLHVTPNHVHMDDHVSL